MKMRGVSTKMFLICTIFVRLGYFFYSNIQKGQVYKYTCKIQSCFQVLIQYLAKDGGLFSGLITHWQFWGNGNAHLFSYSYSIIRHLWRRPWNHEDTTKNTSFTSRRGIITDMAHTQTQNWRIHRCGKINYETTMAIT